MGGSLVPSSFPGPPFISCAFVSIAGSQIINDRLNVLSMILLSFQFCNFCSSIQHCEFMILKMWNLNDSLTIGLLQQRLLTCLAQERRFRLWNPIILQPECSRLKCPVPGAFRLTLTRYCEMSMGNVLYWANSLLASFHVFSCVLFYTNFVQITLWCNSTLLLCST